MSETTDLSRRTAPAALAIIDRMSASLNEVHSYAFEQLTAIEQRIARLKAAIMVQKNRSQQESQIYIELVDSALRVAADLDRAVEDIARVVRKAESNGDDAHERAGANGSG